MLEIRTLSMPRLYDLAWTKPAPLVERYLRQVVDERVDAQGRVERALDPADGERAVAALLAEKVEAMAICLLRNSFANRTHLAKYHFHPYAFEIAGLVRLGCMNRDEGLAKLDEPGDPSLIDTIREKLGIPSDEMAMNPMDTAAKIKAYIEETFLFGKGELGEDTHDVEPKSVTYLVLGIEGLAPYFFEAEAHLFVAGNGDISAWLRFENDLLLTQRLILQPHLEVNLYAQDVPKLDVGAGLSKTEIGFQTRFEITRKFAPYIDLTYDCKFGETSSIARSHGEDVDAVRITVGLRLMF